MLEIDCGRLNTSPTKPTKPTSPTKPTIATIRHRTTRTKGRVMRDSMPYIMFKPGECAEKNWRDPGGCKYLAMLIEGVKFVHGEDVQKPNQVQVAA